MRKLITCLIVVLVSFITSSSFAQEGVTVKVGGVDDTNFPQLTIQVNLQDANGLPVSGLSAEEMQVKVNDTPVSISSFQNITADELSISVVLVIEIGRAS